VFLFLAKISARYKNVGFRRAYLNSGKKEKAIETLKKAEGMFREMGMDYWLGKAQEVLAAL